MIILRYVLKRLYKDENKQKFRENLWTKKLTTGELNKNLFKF